MKVCLFIKTKDKLIVIFRKGSEIVERLKCLHFKFITQSVASKFTNKVLEFNCSLKKAVLQFLGSATKLLILARSRFLKNIVLKQKPLNYICFPGKGHIELKKISL